MYITVIIHHITTHFTTTYGKKRHQMGKIKAPRSFSARAVVLYAASVAAAAASVVVWLYGTADPSRPSSTASTMSQSRAPPPRLLSLSDIEALYAKHRVSDAYLSKWHDARRLDEGLERVAARGFDPRGKDAPRVFTILDFQEWVTAHKLSPRKMLVADEGDPELRFIDAAQTIEYRYQGA